MTILVYIIIGLIAGLFSGLLGIGGGIFIVPALDLVFKHFNLSSDYTFHVAVGTSLASMVIITLSSALAHRCQGHVIWPLVKRWLPGLLIGVVLGVQLANRLPSQSLRFIFAIFMGITAIRILRGVPLKSDHQLLKRVKLFSFGMGIGAVSGILGIGLGSIGIPFLMKHNIPIRRASAIVASCTVPVALCGAISAIIAGWHVIPLSLSIGYVYWPAFLCVGIASTLAAPSGAYLANRLSTLLLQRIFGVFLLIVCFSLLR